jgi:MraZ protein
LDEKGRFALPKRYRDRLPAEPELMLTAGPDDCLLLYEMPAWEGVASQLQTMSSFNDRARDWKRKIIGHADPATLDKSDRLQIPSSLRMLVNIKKDLWLIGGGHYIEIWDLETYQDHNAKLRANPPKENPAGAEHFSL